MSGKGKHIVLVGFMGSGKSTIGRLLAEELERDFVDTDYLIKQKEGRTITRIFEEEGEKYFRSVESRVLRETLNKNKPSVISTGGGAPCFRNGMDVILEYGASFYLKVSRVTVLERLLADSTRPLVMNKTKRELRQFIDVSLRNREEYYLRADWTILANKEPDVVAARILKYLGVG